MSASNRRYIVSPAYDWAFFLAPPLLALLAGIAISSIGLADVADVAGVALGALVHAHLVAVFFRSHGNAGIRRRHPYRFFAVPVVLWIALVSSPWIAVTASIVATFWDVWHSGAQTFGFARIYDRNHGNPPDAGRRLDFWLNQLLYFGPVLGGATLLDHLAGLRDYEDLGTTLFTAVPVAAGGARRVVAIALLVAGTVFVAAYVAAHVRLARRGWRVSPLKVFLVASTGLCSVYTWGWNSFGEAFFIMNLFHAVQYLALVWAREGRSLETRFGLSRGATAAVFFGSVLLYGLGAELLDADVTTLWAITIVVSLMHFWYDGFIWSVARREV